MRSRLERVEKHVKGRPCPHCRPRSVPFISEGEPLPPGTGDPCAHCGRVAPGPCFVEVAKAKGRCSDG